MSKNLSLFLFLFIPINAFADYGCVQYQKVDYSWGEPYRVPVDVVTGKQLFDATKNYKYNKYSNYAVVKWPNGGYSALTFSAYQQELPLYYQQTVDQHGKPYRVKKAPSYGNCTRY